MRIKRLSRHMIALGFALGLCWPLAWILDATNAPQITFIVFGILAWRVAENFAGVIDE